MNTRRLPLTVLLSLVLLAGCAGAPGVEPAPETEPAATDAAPTPATGPFAAAAEYSAAHGGRVLLVMQGEQVVLEVGHAGADPGAPHPLREGTEGFWGLVAAAAGEDGLLAMDEPVATTVPLTARRWRDELRVVHLLEFTSGLEPGFGALAPGVSSDRYARALGLDLVSRPGERFQYGPGQLFVFAELLARKLERAGRDGDPVAYLESRLLTPIGAALGGWERDARGRPDPVAGASMSARDWARFGRLVLNRGRVGDQQLLSPEAVRRCVQGSDPNPAFGLGLWLNAPPPSDSGWQAGEARPAFTSAGPPDLAVASGRGNQRLYIVPSLDLVVARFGVPDPTFRDAELLSHFF